MLASKSDIGSKLGSLEGKSMRYSVSRQRTK